MRSSRVCQFAAITMLLLFCLPLLPVVSASGNGLLMDSNSLQINGDLEVGQGDINVTNISVGRYMCCVRRYQFKDISM